MKKILGPMISAQVDVGLDAFRKFLPCSWQIWPLIVSQVWYGVENISQKLYDLIASYFRRVSLKCMGNNIMDLTK